MSISVMTRRPLCAGSAVLAAIAMIVVDQAQMSQKLVSRPDVASGVGGSGRGGRQP